MPSAIQNVKIKKDQFIGTAFVRCKIKSPTQLVRGPGKMGKKLPIKPRTMKRKDIAIKKKSIIEI